MAGQPPAVLLKALEVSARALDEQLFKNFDRVLATGQLFLLLVDNTYQINDSSLSTPDEKHIWEKIQNRIEEIFAPGLIKWEQLRKNLRLSDRRLTSGGRSKSAISLTLKTVFFGYMDFLWIQSKKPEIHQRALNGLLNFYRVFS